MTTRILDHSFALHMILADAELFRAINNLAGRNAALDAVGVFFAEGLIYLMAIAAIAPAIYFAARHRWLRMKRKDAAAEARLSAMALHAAITAALALIGNYLFSLAVFRPRPFVALQGVHKLIGMPAQYKSFPSDHTSLAFAIAFSVLFFRPRAGALLLACAMLVGLGRVYVGVHYPADIIAGIAVGFFWAALVRVIGAKAHEIDRLKRFFRSKNRFTFL